jgi:hypothetical protein
MRYCVSADPPLDEGALQERETWVLPGVAERDWGGVEVVVTILTVSVVVAVEVPLRLFADRMYMNVPVAFGVTATEEDVVEVERLRLLPVTRTEDAFVMFQEKRDEEPRVMDEGDAEKEEMVGDAPFCVVPLVLVLSEETLPTPS